MNWSSLSKKMEEFVYSRDWVVFLSATIYLPGLGFKNIFIFSSRSRHVWNWKETFWECIGVVWFKDTWCRRKGNQSQLSRKRNGCFFKLFGSLNDLAKISHVAMESNKISLASGLDYNTTNQMRFTESGGSSVNYLRGKMTQPNIILSLLDWPLLYNYTHYKSSSSCSSYDDDWHF